VQFGTTPTPALIERHPGGSSANTAAWLGHIRRGGDVHFFGQVLAEADNARHTRELEKFGVKAHLQSDTETFERERSPVIVEGEKRTMLTDRGANVIFDLDTVPQDLIAIAEYLHFTGQAIIDERQTRIRRDRSPARSAHGVSVSLDPPSLGSDSFPILGSPNSCDSVTVAHVLRPNEDEVRILSGL